MVIAQPQTPRPTHRTAAQLALTQARRALVTQQIHLTPQALQRQAVTPLAYHITAKPLAPTLVHRTVIHQAQTLLLVHNTAAQVDYMQISQGVILPRLATPPVQTLRLAKRHTEARVQHTDHTLGIRRRLLIQNGALKKIANVWLCDFKEIGV